MGCSHLGREFETDFINSFVSTAQYLLAVCLDCGKSDRLSWAMVTDFRSI